MGTSPPSRRSVFPPRPHTPCRLQVLSNVYNSGGAALQTTESAARVVILREVLPDGREGSAVRFPQAALDDLPALFKKTSQRTLPRISLRARNANECARCSRWTCAKVSLRCRPRRRLRRQPRRRGIRHGPPATNDLAPESTEELQTVDAEQQPDSRTAALSAATAGVGIALAASDESWSRRVDAALSQFRKFSRSPPAAQAAP